MHQSQSIPQPDSQHSDIFHTFSIQPLYRTEHLQFNFTYKTFTLRCNRDIFPDSYCTIYLCALSCSHIFSFLTSHRWNRDAFIFKSDDIFENCIFQEQFSTIFLLKVLYHHSQEESRCGQRTQHYNAPVADLDHFLFSLFDGQFLPIHKISLFSQIMDMIWILKLRFLFSLYSAAQLSSHFN